MFKIIYTNRFDKDALKCAKRGLNLDLLEKLIEDLRHTGTVPTKHRPHTLSGNMEGYWECHVKADWLLIWLKNDTLEMITLMGTGSHSDLF